MIGFVMVTMLIAGMLLFTTAIYFRMKAFIIHAIVSTIGYQDIFGALTSLSAGSSLSTWPAAERFSNDRRRLDNTHLLPFTVPITHIK